MMRKSVLAAAMFGAALCMTALAVPAGAADTPKRGGTLTYMIPADAPPSLDGHRETTFATVHATAPFYSVLIRVNPNDPSSTTDFVCDLCTEMPTPTQTRAAARKCSATSANAATATYAATSPPR